MRCNAFVKAGVLAKPILCRVGKENRGDDAYDPPNETKNRGQESFAPAQGKRNKDGEYYGHVNHYACCTSGKKIHSFSFRISITCRDIILKYWLSCKLLVVVLTLEGL